MMTQLKKLAAIAALICVAPFAAAQPVLTNGGFEQSPPNTYGNNIGWSIAPWVLGAGSTNVVSVDGPGGLTWYGSNGPESDATGGVGNPQHYFDQADTAGEISQEFTPLCTGDVTFGSYFSSRGNAGGVANVSILDANRATLFGPATVTVPSGTSETDPWQLASFTASLTANTQYFISIFMDNQLNMDNAYVAFDTQCDEHTPPCFVTNTCNEPETNVDAVKTCEQATYNLDGSYDLNCTITVDIDNPAPAQTVIYDQFSIGGNLSQLAINTATSSDAWSCGHSAVTPNPLTEFSCVLNAADVPAGGQSTIDVNLTIPADTDITDVKNCASGKYTPLVGPGSDRIDESCVEIVFPPEPPEPNCVPFKQGVFKCDEATGTYVVELTNTALPNFDPNDVRIVSITPGVTVSQNPNNPLEMAITGATAGQTIRITTEAIHENGGEGRGIDLCCMGEMEITIPDDMPCEGPVDVSVNKVWQDVIDFAELGYTGTQVPPSGFHVEVDVPVGTLQPGDVVTVSDPTSGQINVTSFGTPLASAPWNCVEIGGAWTCTYLVPATGAVMPADIYWPAIKDGESHVKNCANVALSRGGQTVQETTLANNQSCWEENAPIPQADLDIVKSGPLECRTGEPCVFTYTVTNSGTGDFNDAITLDDAVTNTALSGQTNFGASGGNFVSISPSLCPIADLTSGLGCTGTVSIPAGGSEVFIVTYNPPIFAGEGDFGIENCVGLSSVLRPLGAAPLESCHLTEITKPQLEIVKSGPAECPVGQGCDFTVTINNTSGTAYSGPVLLSDMTTVSQFVVSNVSPMPVGCGGSLPANPFACVTNISLAPGASTSYTFTMTPMTHGQVVAESGENCARLGALPVGTPNGDHSFQYYGEERPLVTQGLADLMQSQAPIGESCVPLSVDEEDPVQTNFSVTKTCGEATQIITGEPHFAWDAQCTITVTANPVPTSGTITLDDVPAFNLGETNVSSNDPWSCTGSGPSESCQINASDFPASGTSVLTVDMVVSDFLPGSSFQNCANLSNSQDNSQFGSCADVSLPTSDTTTGELNVVKTCTAQPRLGAVVTFVCEIKVTATGPVAGQINLQDQLTYSNVPGGDPNGMMGQMSSNDPWACSTAPYSSTNAANCSISAADFAATGYNSSVYVVVQAIGTDLGEEDIQNCATAQSGSGVVTTPSCAVISTPTAEPTPEFNVFKECGPITEVVGGGATPGALLSMNCVIKLQPLTPFSGSFVLTDVATNLAGGGSGSIVGVGSSDPSVTCPIGGLSMNCNVDGPSYPLDSAGNPEEVQINVGMSLTNTGGPVTWQNCAGGTYTFNTGAQMNVSDYCVSQSYTPPSGCTPVPEIAGDQIDNDCDGEVDEVTQSSNLTTTKTCSPIVVDEHALQGVSQCSITLTADNLPSGQIITLQDVMTASNGSSIPFIGSFANVTGAPAGMACAETTNGAANCTISSDDFMAAQPIVLDWTSTISGDWDTGPDFENGETLNNCATTTLAASATLPPHHSTAPSCVTIPVQILEDNTTQIPLVDIPPITLEKSSTGPCSVNVAAQNYRCGFELNVTNNGKDEFNAPMVLSDTFGSPKPSAIRGIDGAGWTCTTKGRDGTSCTNGALKLAPKDSSTVSMQLTLPGQRQGGTFENCAAIGVGDDPIQQAMIAQTALNQIGFDVGAVDGQIGPNTRKGLRGLQEQLGLEPSGELSPAFFNAIGLEMAADATPSCVIVDLPPMPEPPLVCQASTTVKRGNACVCRYKNMYQKDKTACGCVKGTRFVKGQGCKKVDDKPRCDPATTVAKGNSCQCRYANMYKKNNKISCGCVKGTEWRKGEGCIKKREERKCPIGTINLKGICISVNIGIGGPKEPSCDVPGKC